jgi:hypothetical protein
MYDFSWVIYAPVFKIIVVILLAIHFTLRFLETAATKLESYYDDKQFKIKAVQPAQEKTYIINAAYLRQWLICNILLCDKNDERHAQSSAISR